MKGGNRQQPAGAPNLAPLSPTSKTTAKYKNKDGSKFITVPKGSTPADSSQGSPTIPSIGPKAVPSAPVSEPATSSNQPTQPVNRKKQKRREKAAAKAAAEQARKSQPANGSPSTPASHEQHSGEAEAEAELTHDDDEHYPDADSHREYPHNNGYGHGEPSKGKKSKKKKKKSAAASADGSQDTQSHHNPPSLLGGPGAHHDDRRPSGMSREKIWDNSNAEERERIKEFWLGLTEEQRKSLVKVEKDAVLKKMKEQQKHTCSCTVCGRKRTAIEEELEGLYDAYYQELEHYANHPDERNGPPMLRSHQPYGRPRGLTSSYSNSLQPSHGRIVEHVGDEEEEEGEDDYSEEELDEDEYSDEAEDSDGGYHGSDYPHDFFNFGNSLTVQGGILTVADDLLKNDGKKFIEMMEQLAERRMAREEDAREQFERNYDHVNGDRYSHAHAHPPPEEDEEFDDDEDYDEEDDDEYDSQEDEDTMTEEQRMEEGRRMFQIFAARMFEQRVLSAYREKVAKERQDKLIEEEEAEKKQESERKAKKAKEAQKRKEKAAKKKQELASQKAEREAEKAAQEAARREEEARKAEEQRRKAEEKRKKKEAQKKAEEEERKRKEAERLRQIHEREEAERRVREQKEREKKEKKMREEQRLKEKQEKLAREQKEQEIREQKEREARGRIEQQEREKREREMKARATREAKEAKEKEKEKKQQEERAAHKAAAIAAAALPVPITLPKRPAPGLAPAPVPALPQQQPASYSSPQISVATPTFPKAPTPMRARQSSQQESTAAPSSQSGSGPSQNPSPHPLTPVHVSPGPIGPVGRSGSIGIGLQGLQQTSHPTSPSNASVKALPPQPGGLFGMPPTGLPFAPTMPFQGSIPPGFPNPMAREPIFTPQMPSTYRPTQSLGSGPSGFGAPIGGRVYPLSPPPGFPGPLESPVTNVAQLYGTSLPRESGQSHSRQNSGTFEPVTPSAASQPISRPTPIGRPASVVQGQRPSSGSSSNESSPEEFEAPRLGSSALLDENDKYHTFNPHPRAPLNTLPPGPAPMVGFPPQYGGMDSMLQRYGPWGPPSAPQMPPGPPPGLGFGGSASTAMPWAPQHPGPSGYGNPALIERPSESPAIVMRKLLCQLTATSDEYVPLDWVKAKLRELRPDWHVDDKYLVAISETEGDHHNGGGSFETRDFEDGSTSIRWVQTPRRNNPRPIQRAVGPPGDIGSAVAEGSSDNTT